MNKEELYTFEDKTSDEVLLINGFTHINQLIPYVNQLQQENKQLREKLDKNTEIYLNASKYGSKMEGKVVVLEYILEELKKWLEECRKDTENIQLKRYCCSVLDKIKELEEGVK